MASAKAAKKRLLVDQKSDTAFEAIAAERDRKAATGQPRAANDPHYWRKACMDICQRLKVANKSNELAEVQVRILKEQRADLTGEVDSLKAELHSMRAQRNRANKETFNLRKKLTAITKDAN